MTDNDTPTAAPANNVPQTARAQLAHPLHFTLKVLRDFRNNQGLLLSGACAYYTLLSIVPLFALLLIVLSQFFEQEQLLRVIGTETELVIPGYADALVTQLRVFLQHWELIGVVGFVFLLFFSSMAFTALENAMSVIFFHRVAIKRRHFLISAIIPYFFILLLAIGLLLVSAVSGSLHALDTTTITVMGQVWSLSGVEKTLVYLLGIIGETLLLTSLYLVMPVGRLELRHALIGGITAVVLWEITRQFLVWYFSTLSLVNVVYGTFATAIIILITLEAAATILLIGAQVIAEYERIGTAPCAPHGLQT